MRSDVYITLESDGSHLVVRGELSLLEKLLRALRADYTELASMDRERDDEAQREETER